MGWSGSDFQRTHNFSADASAGINIVASRMDAEFNNFETGLEACLKTDGTNAPLADFAMGGYKHTNVGAAASTNQYLRLDQFQQYTPVYAAFSGTAEAMSASTTPVYAALVTGHTVLVSCPSANASSVTLNVNNTSAVPVRNPDGTAVAAGAVRGLRQYTFNGTQWLLMNAPQGGTVAATTEYTEPVKFSTSVAFTGNVVVSGSASFAAATVYDGAAQQAIGYRDVPIVVFDIGRKLSINDRSKMLYHATTSASELVIPSCASVAFAIGTPILVQVGAASGVVSVSAAGGTATIVRAGTGSTGSRILSAAAQMQLIKVAPDTWFAGGAGMT